MTNDERTALEAVGAKVDQVLQILNDPDFGVRVALRDHEKRLRATERWRYSIPVSFLIAAASIGIAIARAAH